MSHEEVKENTSKVPSTSGLVFAILIAGLFVFIIGFTKAFSQEPEGEGKEGEAKTELVGEEHSEMPAYPTQAQVTQDSLANQNGGAAPAAEGAPSTEAAPAEANATGSATAADSTKATTEAPAAAESEKK